MKHAVVRGWIAALAFAAAASASAADLTLLCAGAMKAPVSALLARRDPTEPRVVASYATAGAIADRIAKGERPDVVVASSEVVYALMKQKLVDASTRRALGETEVGVAVRADAAVPDISTPDALRATLLAARRVVIVDPTRGTSGRLVENLFQELKIGDAMRDKTMKVEGGNVVEAVARGEADLGLQQISEILPVAGVRLVGPLPGDLQRLTRYDAAIMVDTPHRQDADALLAELDSKASHAEIERHGFTRAR